MNEEYRRGWIATAKHLVALLVGLLWWLAGRGDILGFNFHRRVWLPLIIVVAVMIFDLLQRDSFKRWFRMLMYALMWPIYYLCMSAFSYGASSWLRPLLGPVLQRVVVGIMWAVPALPVAWLNKKWWVYGVHIAVFTTIMTALVALNASEHEALVGFAFAWLVPFMVEYD